MLTRVAKGGEVIQQSGAGRGRHRGLLDEASYESDFQLRWKLPRLPDGCSGAPVTLNHLIDVDRLLSPRMPSIGHRNIAKRCDTVGVLQSEFYNAKRAACVFRGTSARHSDFMSAGDSELMSAIPI